MQKGDIDNGSVWKNFDLVACVEASGNGFGIVVFKIEKGILKFIGAAEFLTEKGAREYLAVEGFKPAKMRVEMRVVQSRSVLVRELKQTISLTHTAKEGYNMSKIQTGQVWQNGRVVVNVQGQANLLNLVQFEITGKRLRFMSAKMFKDEDKAAGYITGLNCVLTDKVLVAAEESASVI